jgi:HEAT repeat protein
VLAAALCGTRAARGFDRGAAATLGEVVMRTLILLAALGAVARADGLTAQESAWARQCTRALEADSERVRQVSVRALAALGVDAIPVIVAEAPALKTDRGWAALKDCLVSMGRAEAATTLGSLRPKWPATARARLEALLESLRAPQPAAVDEKVRKLLEPYKHARGWSTADPAIRALVALGREAVPALLKILGEVETSPVRMRKAVAAEALSRLVREEDRPELARLVAQGDLEAAKCLARIPGEETLDALLVPVRKGLMSHDLLDALGPYRSSPRVGKALIDYLDRFGIGDWASGAVARFLGDQGVWDAAPILLRLLRAPGDASFRANAACGLAQLGGKEAIPVLIDVLAAGDEWARHEAGEMLNRIRGERIYVGRVGRPGESDGNAQEAAADYASWWEKVENDLRFDRDTRRWSVAP